MSWEEKKEKITLEYPVKWTESTTVTELDFRPLTTGDLMKFTIDVTGRIEMGQMLEIAANILETEGGSNLIKKLHPSDGFQVIGLVSSFLGDSQEGVI